MYKKKSLPKELSTDSTTIRAVVLRLLARRDYGYQELVTLLNRRGYEHHAICAQLDAFKQKGYLDDTRFTSQYVDYRRKRGFGPKRIAQELKKRGIDDSIIAEKTKITDNDWLTEMQMLLTKRVKKIPLDDAKHKAKLVRFFLNRGFTQAQIHFLFKAHSHPLDDNHYYETE